MKIPIDPDNPTMKATFKVSGFGFLFKPRAVREDYMRRRRQAVLNDQAARSQRIDEWADRKRAESAERKADRKGTGA